MLISASNHAPEEAFMIAQQSSEYKALENCSFLYIKGMLTTLCGMEFFGKEALFILFDARSRWNTNSSLAAVAGLRNAEVLFVRFLAAFPQESVEGA